MSELGRNVIDLEGQRNARDAAQAQAQNQFLAQLNQAMLARQQMGQQSQQQDKALLFQALQHQAQQQQQDRDFGLRKSAQEIQNEQFQKGLELQRGQLEYARTAGSPKLAEGIFGANIDLDTQNRNAAGVAQALNEELAAEDRRHADDHGPFTFESNSTKRHDSEVARILAKALPFMGALQVVHDPKDPSKISLIPNAAPPFKFPRRGGESDTGENSPLPRPKPAPQDRSASSLPIFPINPAPQNAGQANSGVWNMVKDYWSKKLSGSTAAPQVAGPIPVASQVLTPRFPTSQLIPMVGPDGQVSYKSKGDVSAWSDLGWSLHPSVTGFAPQIPDIQNPVSGDYNPFSAY